MSTPNVIPMADIMLVLLIIFMVVTPMLQKGKQVDLASVTNTHDMQNADKDDAIIVAAEALGERALQESAATAKRIWDAVTQVLGKDWSKEWGKGWGKQVG